VAFLLKLVPLFAGHVACAPCCDLCCPWSAGHVPLQPCGTKQLCNTCLHKLLTLLPVDASGAHKASKGKDYYCRSSALSSLFPCACLTACAVLCCTTAKVCYTPLLFRHCRLQCAQCCAYYQLPCNEASQRTLTARDCFSIPEHCSAAARKSARHRYRGSAWT
jgi:hypothetical protein